MPCRKLTAAAICLLVLALGAVRAAPGSRPSKRPADEQVFWAFLPPVDPPLPTVKRSDWPESPLDHFILAGLESKGLEPAPPADKRTLIRRATFDLIGLPPTPDEIDAFLADDSPDAFARVVDRLLASPRYGERWGRHWLDVARYADSNGMDENLAYGNAFRYRDYVIAAFNSDKPYDEFVREQLAGDLISGVNGQESEVGNGSAFSLTPASARLVATGFLSLGPKMLAEDDPVKMEMDIIDEQLDTIGRTFMGLTLGCARCHDHKYDPLTMADYYSLAGIFKSTRTMDNFKVVARWHERPLGTQGEIAEQETRQQAIAAKKAEIDRLTTEANHALLGAARRNVGKYLLAATTLRREHIVIKDLKSRISDDPSASPAAIVIEAENFVRGNVKREFTGYGEKIGVIYNQGELPNFAEFDVEIIKPGAFQIELRFAAGESRPVRVFVNGQLARSDAAGKTTGSWYPDTQAWSAETIVSLGAGKNLIRLERDQPFPHFDKLALVPLPATGLTTSVPRTPDQLAADAGLNAAILEQWSKYLDRTKDDPASPLHAWHAATSIAAPAGASPLFADLKESIEQSLAARYQQLCDEADRAWQELRATPAGKDAKQLGDAVRESLRRILHDPKGPFAVPEKPERFYAAELAAKLAGLRDELADLEKSFAPLPDAMAVRDGEPQNLRVHLRGSHLTPGDEVPRQFPQVLRLGTESPVAGNRSGRLEFAEWLTRPDHPLTSRVFVNRLWHWHFGTGLVRTTDNFGRLGERPSNPVLLDWLARRFVEGGWSIKAMHRTIMLSATYQMSTAYGERAAALDPENRLHWRMNRRRLEAEAIRDAIFAVSGQLDVTMGGTLLDTANRAYVKGYPNSVYDKYDFNRRSVYLPVLRSMLYDVFQAFDFCDPSTANGERAATTVAPQALFMLNGKLMAEQSARFAALLVERNDLDDAGRIRLAYERSLGRPPSAAETARAAGFLERHQAALSEQGVASADHRRAWQALCRAMLASNEFIFLE